MSIFSNYPGDPPDEGRDPIAEEIEIQEILESTELETDIDQIYLPASVVDKVMHIVAGLVDQINLDCPRCEEAGIRAANPDMFDAGIGFAAALETPWHPINSVDSLPEAEGQYLFQTHLGCNSTDYVRTDNRVHLAAFYVAWMPIPEYAPPTQVDEK